MTEMNGWLTGFGHDLKYASRGLARSRMFTVVCLLTRALRFGIETVNHAALSRLYPRRHSGVRP